MKRSVINKQIKIKFEFNKHVESLPTCVENNFYNFPLFSLFNPRFDSEIERKVFYVNRLENGGKFKSHQKALLPTDYL